MEPPSPSLSLKLVMLQGPRQGETLEFRPGTAIRIGRVARGNTLPIKDPGISSKHLSIEFESGQWVLRDLDSSNGTVFNGSKIPPHTPFHLHDGATIKIGESTSIELRLGGSVHVAKQGRGRPRKVKAFNENLIVNESGYVEQPRNTRVTRNSKNNQSVIAISESSIGNLEQVANTRVTRNWKNKQSVVAVSESSIGNVDALQVKVEQQQPSVRVTRNSKKKQSLMVISDPILGKSTQNSDLECRVENVVAKKTRGGTRRRKLQQEAPSVCDKVAELKETVVDENESFQGVRETCNRREDQNCSAQEENLNGDGSLPDLEKLTLAEWFDFLEVHLPKQIIDATEEMIDSMRQKAERLREYIIKHKNDKGKMPIEME